jgi:hypothetical protein
LVDKRAFLVKAIKEETKALSEQSEKQCEKDFILNNWKMFAESKSDIFATLKGNNYLTGTDILRHLGIYNVYIEKVSKAHLLAACYDFKNSKLQLSFEGKLKKDKSCTVFYIVNKSGIIVTNQYNLTRTDDFTHVIRRDKQNDIFWSPIYSVKDTLVLYGS